MDEAAERYFALDFDFYGQRFEPGGVAQALQAMLHREKDAPAQLVRAISAAPQGGTRDRLARLAYDGFRHRLDFDGLAQAQRLLGEEVDPAVAFLGEAEPALVMTGNMVEVEYDDRRIPATIGGQPIDIIIDTGAPGVGVSRAIVEREGFRLLEGAGGNAVIPSLGLDYPLEPVILDEVTIGDAVFTSIPAESGDLTAEQQAVLEQNGFASDMIVGLDFFARFFDVVELDQVEGKLRLYRNDPERRSQPNFVMGASRYPLLRIGIGGTDRTVIVDTGSGNNNLPPEWISALGCKAYREFQRSWGSFGEYLLPLDFPAAGGPSNFWISARDFGADEIFNARGVLGSVNGGRLRIDLEDANISWLDYDPALANYDFAATRLIEGECPGL